MTQMPGCRIDVGVIGWVPLVENEPVAAVVQPHPHLYHYECGRRIWHGTTEAGAPILVCRSCNSLADERRVS